MLMAQQEASVLIRVIKSYQGLKPFYGGRGNQYDQEHLSLTYTHTGNSASDDLYFDIDVLDNSFVSVEVSSPDYEAFKTLLDYSSEQNTDFAVYPQSSKLEVFSGKV
ncbi:UNKNOWN [Stylonychia lemnae]|uniref:Uncharacterized protein n=1 Tax=Stylonychia lemnae TaxID=5949 RepID=A0A077ZZR8_STYLE|nr:UNKNOWN [Stylonychia lemnae]|eukprot:CDW75426.1 UNKNOWN [Stylonychia lemnae]